MLVFLRVVIVWLFVLVKRWGTLPFTVVVDIINVAANNSYFFAFLARDSIIRDSTMTNLQPSVQPCQSISSRSSVAVRIIPSCWTSSVVDACESWINSKALASSV
jgi:hypothetical protein